LTISPGRARRREQFEQLPRQRRVIEADEAASGLDLREFREVRADDRHECLVDVVRLQHGQLADRLGPSGGRLIDIPHRQKRTLDRLRVAEADS
jgi:hypothetical protein